MIVLGIETSCDETAVAIVEDGKKILSNIVASQHEIHSLYGGVVPELASRRHVENMPVVIEEALKEASLQLEDIDVFAATRGPGLIGALLVGLSAAKGIAWAERKPLVPVHHLHGHIVAAGLTQEIKYPHLCLLVSGGHTGLYRVESEILMEELSRTRDDAAGEAFDKVAKMLGLGFPGGPALEEAAKRGDETSLDFTVPKIKGSPLDFSFSGLKTAVRTALQKSPSVEAADIAAAFQKTITKALVSRTIKAAEEYGFEYISVAGGVACNGYLRRKMRDAVEASGRSVIWPEPKFCTDNGAMIASAGYYRYRADPESPDFRDFLDLDAVANLPL